MIETFFIFTEMLVCLGWKTRTFSSHRLWIVLKVLPPPWNSIWVLETTSLLRIQTSLSRRITTLRTQQEFYLRRNNSKLWLWPKPSLSKQMAKWKRSQVRKAGEGQISKLVSILITSKRSTIQTRTIHLLLKGYQVHRNSVLELVSIQLRYVHSDSPE